MDGQWAFAKYSPDRFDDLLRLLQAIDLAGGAEPETETGLRQRLGQPDWDPARDIWLAYPAGRPLRTGAGVLPAPAAGWAGFLTFDDPELEPARAGPGPGAAGKVAWLHGGVHPAGRGRGLGGRLLDHALLELGRRHGPALRRVRALTGENSPAGARLLMSRGFAPAQVCRTLRWNPPGPGGPPEPLPPLPPGYAVRPAAAAGQDLASVAALYTAAYRSGPVPMAFSAGELRQTFADRDNAVAASLHLYHGDRLVGFVVSHLFGAGRAKTGVLTYLGVAEGHRRMGLGTSLARLACQGLAALGAARVQLCVVGDNEPALRAYRKAGFVPAESIAEYVLCPTGSAGPRA